MIAVFSKGVKTVSKQTRRTLSLRSNELTAIGASQTALPASLSSTSSLCNGYRTAPKVQDAVAAEAYLQFKPHTFDFARAKAIENVDVGSYVDYASALSIEAQSMPVNKAPEAKSLPLNAVSSFSMLQPPFFEGSEKRIEIQYVAANPCFGDTRGLRRVPRAAWEKALNRAGITIESAIYGAHWDCYMLSESSLFVSRTRIICKTCGQSAPLKILEDALSFGTDLGYDPKLVLFSRSDLLRPAEQLPLHQSFNAERNFLDQMLPHAISANAYTVGDSGKAQWNVYQATLPTTVSDVEAEPVPATLEIVCYGLDPAGTSVWWSDSHSTPDRARFASGLSAAMPNDGVVDEMLFSPCGYSMNCFDQAGAHSTVHVTPQEDCSFASFESTVLDPSTVNDTIRNVVQIFKPKRFSVSLVQWDVHDRLVTSVDPTDDTTFANQYTMGSQSLQRLTHGRSMGYHRFSSFELSNLANEVTRIEEFGIPSMAYGPMGEVVPFLMGEKPENSALSPNMQHEQTMAQQQLKRHVEDPRLNSVPYNGSLFWYTDPLIRGQKDIGSVPGGEVASFLSGGKQENLTLLPDIQHERRLIHSHNQQVLKNNREDPCSNSVPYNGSLFWYTDSLTNDHNGLAYGPTMIQTVGGLFPIRNKQKKSMLSPNTQHEQKLVQQELKRHMEDPFLSSVPYNGSLFWYTDPSIEDHKT